MGGLTGRGSQQRTEVVHEELDEDFLAKEIASDGMRGIKTEVVLEVKERSFNTPAKAVEFLKIAEGAVRFGEIGDEVFASTVVERDINEAERQAEDRSHVVRRDEIEATVGVQLTALFGGKIAKRYSASGEEEFGIDNVVILVRANEMAKGRDLTIRIFEAEEEELLFFGNSGHGIESVEAAIGDKEARTGDGVAIDKGDEGVVLINKGTGLNDSIGIAHFEQIKKGGCMELIIATVIGIVRDKGIGVFICRDVEVGTVAGQ